MPQNQTIGPRSEISFSHPSYLWFFPHCIQATMHEMSRDVQFYQADNLLAMPDKNFVNVPWLGYICRNKAWIVSLTGPFNFIPKTTNKLS